MCYVILITKSCHIYKWVTSGEDQYDQKKQSKESCLIDKIDYDWRSTDYLSVVADTNVSKKTDVTQKKTLITDYLDLSVAPATHCNIMQLQHTATLCNRTHELDALRLCSEDLVETHCNIRHYSVTHCNTLQQTATATCYNSTHELDALKLCAEDLAELPVWQVWMRHVTYEKVMSNTNKSYHACEWVILRCSTLQRTATYCNTLEHSATHLST